MKKAMLVILVFMCSSLGFAGELSVYVGKSCAPSVSDDCGSHASAIGISDRFEASTINRFYEVGFLIDNYELYDGVRRGVFVNYGAKAEIGIIKLALMGGPYLNNTRIFDESSVGSNKPPGRDNGETSHVGWDLAALLGAEVSVALGKKTSVGFTIYQTCFFDSARNGNIKMISLHRAL